MRERVRVGVRVRARFGAGAATDAPHALSTRQRCSVGCDAVSSCTSALSLHPPGQAQGRARAMAMG